MAKYLNSTGVTLLWNKFKTLLSEKADKVGLSNVKAEEVADGTTFPDIDNIVIDTELDTNSDNLITNKAVATALNDKLDKSVYEERNKQFIINGYHSQYTGEIVSNESYRTTGLLFLNRNENLTFKAKGGNVLTFLDENKTPINTITSTTLTETVINKSDYANNAVYFIMTTDKESVGNSYYFNGTPESGNIAISTKLDKEKWNSRHAQFNITGCYTNVDGHFAADTTYVTSGLLFLNKDNNINYNLIVGGTAAAVAFFDADCKFISAVSISGSSTIDKSDFPSNAVYVAYSTTKASIDTAYYDNNLHSESIENTIVKTFTTLNSNKLDKGVYNREHEKFTIKHYYVNIDGDLRYTENTVSTELIPLNHKYDIQTNAVSTADTVHIVTFYDFNKKRIAGYKQSDLTYDDNGYAKILHSNFPSNAVYVRFSGCKYPNIFYYINGVTLESREGAISNAIQAAKLALFVDLWTKCHDCQYDATKTKPFTCNKVELTYDEAVIVYNTPRLSYPNIAGFTALVKNPKTIILASGFTDGKQADFNNAFRTTFFVNIRVSEDNRVVWTNSLSYAFYNCTNLKNILGIINVSVVPTSLLVTAFHKCPLLEEVRLTQLKASMSFVDCPNISIDTLSYAVQNAINTEAITITLHPITYAKVTDTTNTEWHALVALAADKNITFIEGVPS